MLEKTVSFRVTEEEYNLLKEKAKDANLSQGEFMRRSIKETKIYVIPVAAEIASTMACVYNALLNNTPDAVSAAIRKGDALCDLCVSVEKKYAAIDQLQQQ